MRKAGSSLPERRNQYHGTMQVGERREANNGSPCDAAIALTVSVSVGLGRQTNGRYPPTSGQKLPVRYARALRHLNKIILRASERPLLGAQDRRMNGGVEALTCRAQPSGRRAQLEPDRLGLDD